MYHAILLEMLLDLKNISQRFSFETEKIGKLVDPFIAPMVKWLSFLSHPDGDPAQFNDTAITGAFSWNTLNLYAKSLGTHVSYLETVGLKSGFARLSSPSATLLADVGNITPAYQPGHAHAESLCFEFSLGSQRLLVNSGISTYAEGKERCEQRSTAAHNTVEVAQLDSSEVWKSFRVARRAEVSDVKLNPSIPCLYLEAAHNGYRGRTPISFHRRRWEMDQNSLLITDTLEGPEIPALVYLHFYPGITLEFVDGSYSILREREQIAKLWISSPLGRVEESQWHPGFGITVPNLRLVFPLANNYGQAKFSWRTL
jgi:uncharacterized heparinase superfamily protein